MTLGKVGRLCRAPSGKNHDAAVSSPVLCHPRLGLTPPVALLMSYPNDKREYMEGLIASYFAQMHRSVVTDSVDTIAIKELPLARIKRIMKQDSCIPHPRIHADAIPFMAFAVQLFIGHVTRAAWTFSTLCAKRNTLQLKDLKEVIRNSRRYYFITELVDAFRDTPTLSISSPLVLRDNRTQPDTNAASATAAAAAPEDHVQKRDQNELSTEFWDLDETLDELLSS